MLHQPNHSCFKSVHLCRHRNFIVYGQLSSSSTTLLGQVLSQYVYEVSVYFSLPSVICPLTFSLHVWQSREILSWGYSNQNKTESYCTDTVHNSHHSHVCREADAFVSCARQLFLHYNVLIYSPLLRAHVRFVVDKMALWQVSK